MANVLRFCVHLFVPVSVFLVQLVCLVLWTGSLSCNTWFLVILVKLLMDILQTKVQYIKKTTKILKENFNGDIPNNVKELCSLPGMKTLCFINNSWVSYRGILWGDTLAPFLFLIVSDYIWRMTESSKLQCQNTSRHNCVRCAFWKSHYITGSWQYCGYKTCHSS